MSRVIRHCTVCLNPDTRPRVEFGSDGVCLACRLFRGDGQEPTNWAERRREIETLGAWGRKHSRSSYDCIIGVSGGKDSTRQAFYVRDELDLKPLLVSSVYPPDQQVERGAQNLANLVAHGFDCLSVGLDPQTWRKTMREAFRQYANWCKSTELPLYAIPVHIAIGYHIPLIFLGENPAFTLGTPVGNDYGGDATRMKYCNTLSGGSPEKLLVDEVRWQDVFFYTYPSDDDIAHANIRIAYLGHYIEGFNNFDNATFALAHGLRGREEPAEHIGDFTRTQSLDEDFYCVNQYLKYLKFGFGQATDKVGEAIRLGRMDQAEARDKILRYDGMCHPKYIRRFVDYLQITDDEFWRIADGCRNPELWTLGGDGLWRLNDDLLGNPVSTEQRPGGARE